MANARDSAVKLMESRRYSDALAIFQGLIREEATDWSLYYMAGQCARFTGQLPLAAEYLARSVELNKTEPAVFQALGIAMQLQQRYPEAVEALGTALELDPDNALAFNSLALTQKKMGEFEKALHNYTAGVYAVVRKLIKTMKNIRDQRIYEHPETETALWTEYATWGAMYICSSDPNVVRMAFPTSDSAMAEARTREHAGLYWRDLPEGESGVTRLFLPNYFNLVFFSLSGDPAYANLIGNRGTVLQALGREDEASQHFAEAEEFSCR